MKKMINQLDKKIGKIYVPFILLLVSIVTLLLAYPFLRQNIAQVNINTIATQTIRANKTIEDTAATQKAKDAAAENVTKVYARDDEIATQTLQIVSQFFSVISTYRSAIATTTDTQTPIAEQINARVTQFFKSLENENANLKNYTYAFSENTIRTLLTATDYDFSNYERITKKIVESILQDNIYPTTTDTRNAQDKANSMLLTQTYSDSTRDIVHDLMTPAIVATMVVNEEATNQLIETTKQQTSAVVILQGDVIVRQGEVITQTTYDKLALLGMINNSAFFESVTGFVVVLVIQFALVWYFIHQQAVEQSKRNLYVNMYAFFMLFMLAITFTLNSIQSSGVEYIGLVAPIGVVPFVLVPKAKRRLAILLVSFLIVIFFFVGDSGSSVQVPLVWKFYTLIGLLSLAVVSGRSLHKRNENFLTLLIISIGFIVGLATVHGVELFSNTFFSMLAYAVVNVALTYAIIRLGQPYFDLLFEDKAMLRMIELSNPNQPLLKELISKAPGTYHHSIMVANLSANAVEAIGGDSLFTRVACYYHDIGKLKDPIFFTENVPKGMESPHDLLTPFQSRDIIFDHVSDGVKRLTQEQLPQGIIDICAQHHGTTVMKYFYVKAKEMDDAVTEDDFRYPGPKPQTIESAVVSIADSVEAAARSMSQPTQESIISLVQSTIRSRIIDGQFDECPITMKDLKIVEESLISGLSGTYHNRVKYPKLRKDK
ncbi:HDIG domain-containing protein [Carnobacteriaceae bacterium zg-C25]|nr:HDIG domain-containing protein [Carnobacteriaceae bacterium zg-C25]